MFAGFPPKADEATICDLCLDVFHATLSEKRGPKGSVPDTGQGLQDGTFITAPGGLIRVPATATSQ